MVISDALAIASVCPGDLADASDSRPMSKSSTERSASTSRLHEARHSPATNNILQLDCSGGTTPGAAPSGTQHLTSL